MHKDVISDFLSNKSKCRFSTLIKDTNIKVINNESRYLTNKNSTVTNLKNWPKLVLVVPEFVNSLIYKFIDADYNPKITNLKN